MTSTAGFYDTLAGEYHLVYRDWEASIRRQAAALDRLIRAHLGPGSYRILDCTCGIGTQSLGMASLGHEVVGSDVSERSIERARFEAEKRNLSIRFEVADVRTLSIGPGEQFDVVLSADNALPHLLDQADLRAALARMVEHLRPGGLLLASTRDYDAILREMPEAMPPIVSGEAGARRITFQLWTWAPDRRSYEFELFILRESREGPWEINVQRARYRAITRAELSAELERLQLQSVTWTMPESSGFFQPIVTATRAP